MEEADVPFAHEMFVEILVTYFVGRLVLPVVGRVLLHGVVGEVDQPVVPLLQVEVLAGGAQVSFFVEIPPDHPSACMADGQREDSDVKFATIY